MLQLAPVDIVNFIVIFQLLVFSFFLFQKSRNWSPNIFLGIYMLSQALGILDGTLLHLRTQMNGPTVLFFVLTPVRFLWGPAFYFYVRSIIHQKFRFQIKHMIHLIPFFTAIVLFQFHYHRLDSQTQYDLLYNTDFSVQTRSIMSFLVYLQVGLYLIATHHLFRMHRKTLQQYYSAIEQYDPNWLHHIFYGYIFSWASASLIFIYVLLTGRHVTLLSFIVFFVFFIFFNTIFYKALTHPRIFLAVEDRDKYLSSTLTASESMKIAGLVAELMQTEKPFLSPGLSLQDMAARLKVQPRHLSQTVNEHYKQNFYDFINRYRIKDAKQILSDPADKRTILAILYDCGFNTKSSFNTAFKKYTGMTPKEYRKKQNFISEQSSY